MAAQIRSCRRHDPIAAAAGEMIPRIAMLGPLGPTQLACFASWRRAGLPTQFIDTSDKPLPARFRTIVDRYDYVGPLRGLDERAIEEISTALARARSTGLVCVAEALSIKVWNAAKRWPDHVRLLLNSAATMNMLESKIQQIDLAQRAGFDVLPTAVVSVPGSQLSTDFPVVLRPDRASQDASFKAEFVSSKDTLKRFLAGRAKGAPPVVAQRFIRGPSLVVHGSRHADGRHGPLFAFVSKIKNAGVAVALEPTSLDPRVASACMCFADLAELRGAFHFDLMIDETDKRIWFLEVNARFGGTTGKVFAAGYDEPMVMLRAHGMVECADGAARLHSVVNRVALARCLGKALRGDASPIDYPLPDRRRLSLWALQAMLFFRDEVVSVRRFRSAMAFLSQYWR